MANIALAIPELIGLVLNNLDKPSDLLNCACVDQIWNVAALQRLYRGSHNDMRFRTPDITWLNSLLMSSRDRFARNMGFVKHLIICATGEGYFKRRSYGLDELTYQSLYPCRALQTHRDAQLLFQQRPQSIHIPFKFPYCNLPGLKELILHPKLQFLSINLTYIKQLLLPTIATPMCSNTLKQLKGLSVYETRPGDWLGIEPLCGFIPLCDLANFQFHCGPHSKRSFDDRGTEDLLKSLLTQRNLKALYLDIGDRRKSFGEILKRCKSQNSIPSWLGLKALHLRYDHSPQVLCLEQFSDLQIFETGEPSHPGSSLMVSEITRCTALTSLMVSLRTEDDVHTTRIIASACPCLRRLHIWYSSSHSPVVTGSQFESIVSNLPQIEYLDLHLGMFLDGTQFQDLSNCCPKLELLVLDDCYLSLNYQTLTQMLPFLRLEFLCLSQMRFDNPEACLEETNLKRLSKELGRVFPKLQEMAIKEKTWRLEGLRLVNERNCGDGAGNNFDFASTGVIDMSRPCLLPEDDEDRCEDWDQQGRLISKLLPGPTVDATAENMKHLWITKLEIATFKWPFMKTSMFSEPGRHSSLSKLRTETDNIA